MAGQALTHGSEREIRSRSPEILAKGAALLEFERALTPRHVLYEAVLRNEYDKRGVVPFSSKKKPYLETK